MERDALLALKSNTHLKNLLQNEEIQFKPPQSIKNQDFFEDTENPFLGGLVSHSSLSQIEEPSSSSKDEFKTNGWKRYSLTRSKSAPAMVVLGDLTRHESEIENPKFESKSIIKQACLFLIFYLSIGVLIYSLNKEKFSGIHTHTIVDAIYFCILTLCTIGYGDIAPLTPATKIFACVFVLVGFGFIDILLSGLVSYVLDLQESMILPNSRVDGIDKSKGFSAKNYIFDVEKGRMRIRLKVGLALGVVILCISVGSMALYFVEKLDLVDSIYLSVMSVTTVGYGDRAFKTLPGRLFASIWLLFSTLAVARAFLYLAEARIDKRHRRIAKWVLHRDITVQDLLAADINNNGFIRDC